MAPIGEGYYELRLTGNYLESDSGFSQATVLYQFVMEPAGAEIVRSPVFSDLALLACEQQAPPPQPTASPTPRR